MKSNVTLNKPS